MALDPQCLLKAASLNPDYLERHIPRDGGEPVVLEAQPVREASAAWRKPAPLADAGPADAGPADAGPADAEPASTGP